MDKPDSNKKLVLWLLGTSIALILVSVVALVAASPPAVFEAIKNVASFIESVSWPVVVLVIFLVLRDSISSFVSELAEVSFPGGSAKRIEAKSRDLRDESELVKESTEPTSPSERSSERETEAEEGRRARTPLREPWFAPPELLAADAQRIKELPPIRQIDRFRMDDIISELHALETQRGDYKAVLTAYDLLQKAMRTVLQLAPNNKASIGQLIARLRQCGVPEDITELATRIRRARVEMIKRPSAITVYAAENLYDAVTNCVDALSLWWRTNTPAKTINPGD